VVIGDDDALGTFVFRTTGYNSIRSLAARLQYFKAVSGDVLASLPLALKLRGKSTTQSHRAAIYYVDLTTRSGKSLEDTIADARTVHQHREASGFNQSALDEAARLGFKQTAFDYDEEEVQAIVEEFYPEATSADSSPLAQVVVPKTLQDALTQQSG
jgi:hypothetical protein